MTAPGFRPIVAPMKGPGILRGLYLPAVNLLYPANCHVCGTALGPFGDSPLCPACLRAIRPIGARACSLCGLPLPETVPVPEGFLCGECRTTRRYFRRALSAFVYDGPARELVHMFKYSGRSYLARFFAVAIAEAVEGRVDITGTELVVPVPLHRSRRRKRGYNQADEIGRRLARLLGLRAERRALERVRRTASQVGKTREGRRANVRGSFRVVDRRLVRKRSIFLVDDVFTTGATVDECSKVLLRAGASRVVVLTAARDILG